MTEQQTIQILYIVGLPFFTFLLGVLFRHLKINFFIGLVICLLILSIINVLVKPYIT